MQLIATQTTHRFTVSEASRKKILQEKGKYPHLKTAILPCLHIVYDEIGFLSPEGLKDISVLLGLPYTEISEVASFYTLFPKKNMGKYYLQVCTNISCYLCGAGKLLEYLEQKLGVKAGEVTPDGLFSLGTVECLGSCGTPPVLQVNCQDFSENLTKKRVDELIDKMRAAQ